MSEMFLLTSDITPKRLDISSPTARRLSATCFSLIRSACASPSFSSSAVTGRLSRHANAKRRVDSASGR